MAKAPTSLQPRSTPELVDAAVHLLRPHYAAMASLTMALMLPALVTELVTGDSEHIAISVLYSLTLTLATGVLVRMVSDVYLGQEPSVGAAFRALGRRVVPLVIATMLQGLLIVGGFVLFVIPGLLIGAATFAAPMAVMLEGAGVAASFKRSVRLTREARFRVMVILWMTYLLVLVVLIGAAAGLAAVAAGLPFRVHSLLETVIVAFVYPPAIAISTLLYYDLRVRREGLDLEMLDAEIATQAEGVAHA